jgi:hypothetical protein
VLRIASQTPGAKTSAGIDGGLSGGSNLRRPGNKDPHRRKRKFPHIMYATAESNQFTM